MKAAVYVRDFSTKPNTASGVDAANVASKIPMRQGLFRLVTEISLAILGYRAELNIDGAYCPKGTFA
jgi:hypothetical protein